FDAVPVDGAEAAGLRWRVGAVVDAADGGFKGRQSGVGRAGRGARVRAAHAGKVLRRAWSGAAGNEAGVGHVRLAADRCRQAAEEAVGLVVDACGEEERAGTTGRGIVAKG